jgi:hypothetical protein
VAEESRSNYLLTAASLSSMLNMRHHDPRAELARLPVGDPRHVRAVRNMLCENEVFGFVREHGYEVISVASGFEEVSLRCADRFIDTGQVNETEMLAFRVTGAGQALEAVAPRFYVDQQRSRIEQGFHAGEELANERRGHPRFVFIHVPSPHGPIVHDDSGAPVPPVGSLTKFYADTAVGQGVDRNTYGRRYAGQVEFVNKQTLGLVSEILSRTERPPVVLILSDHGSGSGVDFTDLENSDLHERSANFVAAFTPNRARVLPTDVTLVNVFGRVFEAYFDRPFSPLPDTVFGWRDGSIFDTVAMAVSE